MYQYVVLTLIRQFSVYVASCECKLLKILVQCVTSKCVNKYIVLLLLTKHEFMNSLQVDM